MIDIIIFILVGIVVLIAAIEISACFVSNSIVNSASMVAGSFNRVDEDSDAMKALATEIGWRPDGGMSANTYILAVMSGMEV